MSARPRFRPSEEFAPAAAREFARQRRCVAELLPDAEVRHRGGTSIPGALTEGDLDVHVRVPPERFAAAREVLRAVYEPRRRELWSESLAAFRDAASTEIDVELALTAIGSQEDAQLGEAWDALARDPARLAAYNALKRRHEGGPRARYLAEKAAFFAALADEIGGAGA